MPVDLNDSDKLKPNDLKKVDSFGATVAHEVALLPRPDLLERLFKKDEEVFRRMDNEGKTPFHYACELGGRFPNIKCMMDMDPNHNHLATKDEKGKTPLHYIAQRGEAEVLTYLLANYPAQYKAGWVEDKERRLPSDWVPGWAPKSIISGELLKHALVSATNRIINGSGIPRESDVSLLNNFENDWKALLLNAENSGINISDLIAFRARFPSGSQRIIDESIPFLISNSLAENQITKKNLCHLLSVIAMDCMTSPLVKELAKFQYCCKENVLSLEEKKCLKVILDDYNRGLLGKKNTMLDSVVQKLGDSETIQDINRKPNQKIENSESEIIPDNYKKLLDRFCNSSAKCLPKDKYGYIQKQILPALNELIENRDKIVEHRMNISTSRKTYTLPGGILLHTEQMPAERKECALYLESIIKNFLGAVETAYNVGRLVELCHLLIDKGYCFEAKVRNITNFGLTIHDLPKFSELVTAYLYEEYFPYYQVMHSKSAEDCCCINTARSFILTRHKGESFIPDESSGKSLVVEEENITNYLTICSFLDEEPSALYHHSKGSS